MQTKPDIKVNRTTVRMRSMPEVAATIKWAIAQHAERNGKNYSSVDADECFSGTKSASQYLEYLESGWRAGVEGAEGLDGLCTDRLERPQLARNVAGCFANVPAFIAGHPAAMYEMRPEQSERQSLTLILDSSYNAHVDSDTALRYARTVMRMVAWLQAQQIDASVYATVSTHMRGESFCYVTKVREAGEVLQPERIAAVLHPSWLRRAYFALVEYDADVNGCESCEAVRRGSYGQARKPSADILRKVLPDARSVVLLPKVGGGDPEKAIREALSIRLKREE